jgi:hypothetical protein
MSAAHRIPTYATTDEVAMLRDDLTSLRGEVAQGFDSLDDDLNRLRTEQAGALSQLAGKLDTLNATTGNGLQALTGATNTQGNRMLALVGVLVLAIVALSGGNMVFRAWGIEAQTRAAAERHAPAPVVAPVPDSPDADIRG